MEQDLANLQERLQLLETKGQSAEETQSLYQQKLEKKSKELSEKEAELKSVAEQVYICLSVFKNTESSTYVRLMLNF